MSEVAVPDDDGEILCMNCKTPSVEKVDIEGSEYYKCRYCGHLDGRAIYTDGIKVEFMPDGEPKHFSVGALVRDGDSFLIIKRRVWPFLHGLVAGHVDVGETREQAFIREVGEELGVMPREVHVVAHEPHLVGDKCRKGADVHAWTLFGCEVNNEAIVNNSDEAERVFWVSPDEAAALEFSFASGHMLRRIGLIP